MWESCAATLDGCIYFMPSNDRHIIKLDPNVNEAMSSVGDDLGYCERKYTGTVVGIDGCVYGIPRHYYRIIKYDPINHIASFVGEEAEANFECCTNGALGRDGCIYAVANNSVLEIDTINNSHCFVGGSMLSDHCCYDYWVDATLAIDGYQTYSGPSNRCNLTGDGLWLWEE